MTLTAATTMAVVCCRDKFNFSAHEYLNFSQQTLEFYREQK